MERPRPLVLASVILFGIVVLGAGAFLVRGALQRGELADSLKGRETLETFLAEGPVVDEELQERFWAWCDDASTLPSSSSSKHEDWFLSGRGALPQLEHRQHEGARPAMDALSEFLGTDRLVASSRGWLRKDVEGEAWDLFHSTRRMMNWRVMAGAYTWYGVEAMLVDDPEPVFAAIDRLDRAIEPIGLFMDFMKRGMVVQYSDRIYLRLAMRGRLTPARRAAFLRRPPLPLEALAEAYRSERLMLAQPIAEDLAFGDGSLTRAALGRRGSVLRILRNEIYLRWQGPRDARQLVTALTKLERHARGQAQDTVFDEIDSWQADAGPIGSQWLADGRGFLESVVTTRATHRAARLAVHALGMADDSAGLPETHEAFRARLGAAASLLEAARFDLALRYERPAPDRLRISVDPDTPLPKPLEGRGVLKHIRDWAAPAASPRLHLGAGTVDARLTSN